MFDLSDKDFERTTGRDGLHVVSKTKVPRSLFRSAISRAQQEIETINLDVARIGAAVGSVVNDPEMLQLITEAMGTPQDSLGVVSDTSIELFRTGLNHNKTTEGEGNV